MAAELKVKKVAKMGHHEASKDTGRKETIPCPFGCQGEGGVMQWSMVNGSMRYVCGACSQVGR